MRHLACECEENGAGTTRFIHGGYAHAGRLHTESSMDMPACVCVTSSAIECARDMVFVQHSSNLVQPTCRVDSIIIWESDLTLSAAISASSAPVAACSFDPPTQFDLLSSSDQRRPWRSAEAPLGPRKQSWNFRPCARAESTRRVEDLASIADARSARFDRIGIARIRWLVDRMINIRKC